MPMNFIAFYASIPSHSSYYPTHSPHHRPVPFAHTIFPPDPPYNHSDVESQPQSNPTHGQKVSTDPAGRYDLKLENSGPVTKDSLAAESLRSGGAFSAGNPTGISGSRGSSATFAVDPNECGNVRTLYGKREDVLGSREAGHLDRDMTTKDTTVSGGRSQDSSNSAGSSENKNASKNSDGGGLGASKYSGGVDNSGTEGRGSRHTAGAGSSSSDTTRDFEALSNKVPNTARSEETLESGLDWSKVSKDTHLSIDIGGPNDPDRVAAVHMAGQATRQDKGMGHSGGDIGGNSDNRFNLLNDSGRAPGAEDLTRD